MNKPRSRDLETASPQDMELDGVRRQAALDMAARRCERDVWPAAAVQVVSRGRTTGPQLFGRMGVAPDSPPIRDDAAFLVASLTKPVVAMAVLMLVERGLLGLNDRVCDWIPEYDAANKKPTTIRHLLTHTSGLPDMLPNNRHLRMSQAGLDGFVHGACGVTLDFPPGRGVQYQSMGYALLGEIIHRASHQTCGEFLKTEMFEPLGMHDTALGLTDEWWDGPRPRTERICEIRVPEEQREGADWNWNSRYWRTFGAPWGGLVSTPHDLARFCAMMLNRGALGDVSLFSSATIEAATTNQIELLRDIPEVDRRTRGWGCGWRLNWQDHAACFCDLAGPHAYGHWGATGTLFWLDPTRDAAVIILTTQPLDRDNSAWLRLSNAVAAAFVE